MWAHLHIDADKGTFGEEGREGEEHVARAAAKIHHSGPHIPGLLRAPAAQEPSQHERKCCHLRDNFNRNYEMTVHCEKHKTQRKHVLKG
jgi:hypothetical protein